MSGQLHFVSISQDLCLDDGVVGGLNVVFVKDAIHPSHHGERLHRLLHLHSHGEMSRRKQFAEPVVVRCQAVNKFNDLLVLQ